jgi:integrase
VPPHLKQNKYGVWYLVDGFLNKSLRTKTKREAEARLRQYRDGKFGLEPLPTVQKYFDKWILTKTPPLYRPALERDYKLAFNAHILPRFGHMRLDQLNTGDLVEFRGVLLKKGLSVKTARNIIDSSFRAMYRDARAEYKDLQGYDPFMHVQWPRVQREKPDPFTAEERDRIIDYWKENDFFYFPWVFTLFHTGVRPSEASALTWNDDVDLNTGAISITKSRYMGDDSAPKTSASNRTIRIDAAVIEVLKLLPSRALGIKHVFVNKDGRPMNAKKWSEHNWANTLKILKIRHRKFYSMRHTFLTEKIRDGENPFALAQYAGTSVSMLEKDYVGTLGLSTHQKANQEVFKKLAKNPNEINVAGPGFEPGTSRL